MSTKKKIKPDAKIPYAFRKYEKINQWKTNVHCKDVYCENPDIASWKTIETLAKGILQNYQKYGAGEKTIGTSAYKQYMQGKRVITFKFKSGKTKTVTSRQVSMTFLNQISNNQKLGKGNRSRGFIYYSALQDRRAKPKAIKKKPTTPRKYTPEQELWRWRVMQAKKEFNETASQYLTSEEMKRVRKLFTRLQVSKYSEAKWELLNKADWHYKKVGDPTGESKRQLKMWECIESEDCVNLKKLTEEAPRIYNQWDWNEKISHLEEEYERYLRKLEEEGNESALKPAIVEMIKKIKGDMYEAGYRYGGKKFADEYRQQQAKKAYIRKVAKTQAEDRAKILKRSQERAAKEKAREKARMAQKFREKEMKKKMRREYKKTKKKK